MLAGPLRGALRNSNVGRPPNGSHCIIHHRHKAEAKQHCWSATITRSSFANFVWIAKAGGLPWTHVAHHRHFVPEHLSPTDDDLSALAASGIGRVSGKAGKTVSKIYAIFDERRLLSGHMFCNADLSNWHFFYFDQRDFADDNNHWEGGSHIHFINKLWPNRTAELVWKEFCTGKPHMRGALHIRYNRD
jgi:hypothetical protein